MSFPARLAGSFLFILSLALPLATPAQQAAPPSPQDALVARALQNEINAARDSAHPLRYKLRKTSPRLTSVKKIIETRDGDVARLISKFDAPLTPDDAQRENTRLDSLAADPSLQQHRRHSEDADLERALKILHALPDAFLYQYLRTDGGLAKYSFKPNPKFHSDDMETQALTQMQGELWVSAADERVTRLEGHLTGEVDYGWGILGQLDKGGYILIEQAEVLPKLWHTTHLVMKMSFRIVYKHKASDATLEFSDFIPVQPNLDYREAIRILKSE